MRRVPPLSLLLVALLSACSFSSQFVVTNESDAVAEVRYTLKGRGALKFRCEPPAKKTVEQLEDSDVGWRELGADEYLCDEGARAVTVVLRPREALLVGRPKDYFEHTQESADEAFDLESVRVAGAHGSIQYSGRMARTQFVERGNRVFVIAYR